MTEGVIVRRPRLLGAFAVKVSSGMEEDDFQRLLIISQGHAGDMMNS